MSPHSLCLISQHPGVVDCPMGQSAELQVLAVLLSGLMTGISPITPLFGASTPTSPLPPSMPYLEPGAFGGPQSS